jgi:hypothetical protein
MKPILFATIVIASVFRLDAQPNVEWTKFYGGTLYDEAEDIRVTPDGGTIIAGFASSNDGDVTGHHGSTSYADFWVVKTDAAGNLQWQRSYGGEDSDLENP